MADELMPHLIPARHHMPGLRMTRNGEARHAGIRVAAGSAQEAQEP